MYSLAYSSAYSLVHLLGYPLDMPLSNLSLAWPLVQALVLPFGDTAATTSPVQAEAPALLALALMTRDPLDEP